MSEAKGERAEPKPQQQIRLKFKSDRYGYASGAKRLRLKEAIEPIEQWLSFVRSQFGSERLGRAWDLAAHAGLTPTHPSWSEMASLVADARRRLGPVRITIYEEVMPGVHREIPEPEAEPSVERMLRDAALVDNAAYALRKLSRHVEVFGLGFVLIVAGTAQIGEAPGREFSRFAALRAVSRLFRPAAVDHESRLLSELKAASASDEACLALVKELPSTALFAEGAGAMRSWLEELRNAAATYRGKPIERAELDAQYWSQWKLGDGMMLRVPTLGEARRGPSAIDVLHAAANLGIPYVPGHGIRLSVAELTRIALLAPIVEEGTLASMSGAPWYGSSALAELAKFDDTGLDQTRKRAWRPSSVTALDTVPVFLLRPASADSPAWSWHPESGMPAIAVMPSEVRPQSNQHAKEEVLLLRRVTTLISRGRGLWLIEAIETGAEVAEQLAGLTRIFFGAIPPTAGERAATYVGQASSLAELLARIGAAKLGPFGHVDARHVTWQQVLRAARRVWFGRPAGRR